MSELPSGSLAARTYLERVAVEGAVASAAALSTFFALPLVRQLVRSLAEHWIVDPSLNFLTAKALAVKYVADQNAFDKDLIHLEILDRENAPREVKEAALVQAEKSMLRFIKRGRLK